MHTRGYDTAQAGIIFDIIVLVGIGELAPANALLFMHVGSHP